jgi:histidinol-phosphate aminotransferase
MSAEALNSGLDLAHHGDAEVGPGLVDLAVNVRPGTPPPWLARRLRDSVADLAAYPDPGPARAALARRHGRDPAEVLPTAGAAEAFVLLARVLRPRRAVVVHPQFTEPEAALRAAGHRPERAILTGDFRLGSTRSAGSAEVVGGVGRGGRRGRLVGEGRSGKDGRGDTAPVPEDADLVFIGNPTNPTSVLHPAAAVAALARRGRTLVVDEAFMDCVPGEPDSLAGRRLPGLVVIRSLTKTWGLAGLRAGYVLAEPELIAALAAAQPLWAVSTPALVAMEACSAPAAVGAADAWAAGLAVTRARFAAGLAALGPHVVPRPRASFLCLRTPGARTVRVLLRERGYAVRRGDTFPGLGPDWLRIAVRDAATNDAFLNVLRQVLHDLGAADSPADSPGEP